MRNEVKTIDFTKFYKREKNNRNIKTENSKQNNEEMLNCFKYIDTHEYWYDDPDDPDYNTWFDVEGIGYGWLWLHNEDSEKLQRKSIINFAMGLYRNSKNEMCIRRSNEITDIFLENKKGNCIIQVRVSNKELNWW